MGTENKKLGYVVRIVVGVLGAALIILFALTLYIAWAVNGKYFHNYGWPHIGWGDMLCVIGAGYLLLVGCVGRWRLGHR